jgi:hypothetical protein
VQNTLTREVDARRKFAVTCGIFVLIGTKTTKLVTKKRARERFKPFGGDNIGIAAVVVKKKAHNATLSNGRYPSSTLNSKANLTSIMP